MFNFDRAKLCRHKTFFFVMKCHVLWVKPVSLLKPLRSPWADIVITG